VLETNLTANASYYKYDEEMEEDYFDDDDEDFEKFDDLDLQLQNSNYTNSTFVDDDGDEDSLVSE